MDGLTLKAVDEEKINNLFSAFGKTEANLLKFSELTMLLLDRNIFSHRFTFIDYHQIFVESQNVKNRKPLNKETVQGEKIVGKEQLLFVFHAIAKILYRTHPSYHEKFYSQFLSEKVGVEQGEYRQARIPVFDDLNRKLFVEEAVQIMAQYEKQFLQVFDAYVHENHFSLKKNGRALLNSREISLQEKQWVFTSLISYLKQSETTPHLITVENIQEIIKTIVPAINSKQQQFYNRHVLIDSYHKELEQNQKTTHLGDPGLLFHELQFLTARIAYDTFPKDQEKKSIEDVIERYYKYLFLRSNDQIDEVPLPALNRKMITKMKTYYKSIQDFEGRYAVEKGKDESGNLMEKLVHKIKKQVFGAPELGLDFTETIKNLDKDLPKIPTAPVVIPEDPPPYNKANAITIGQQPPPEPKDNDKGAKQEKKGGGKDKDELPERFFKWEQMPQTKTAIEDHLKSVQNKITFEVQPLHDMQRGIIRRESFPVLIGETLFPGELPKNVVPFLKEASDALNERNFILALECYENGLKTWKKTAVQIDASTELFFEFSKGNIFLNIGKLEYALQSFYSCRKFAETSKLPFNNPDRSLPYFGLGEVLFEMKEYQLATRSFLKAREIRENVLGLENVQTATVFNNLACCYFLLGRAHQALGYIQIAEIVLDGELGEHHERTMTSRSNCKKILNGTYDNKAQYRKFWQVFEEDAFEKKKKKAEDKKKK